MSQFIPLTGILSRKPVSSSCDAAGAHYGKLYNREASCRKMALLSGDSANSIEF